PFARRLLCRRRTRPVQDALDLAAEAFLVEFEGFFTVTVEVQIGIHLHVVSPHAWGRKSAIGDGFHLDVERHRHVEAGGLAGVDAEGGAIECARGLRAATLAWLLHGIGNAFEGLDLESQWPCDAVQSQLPDQACGLAVGECRKLAVVYS